MVRGLLCLWWMKGIWIWFLMYVKAAAAQGANTTNLPPPKNTRRGRMSRLIICEGCGREREHIAFGLCEVCYNHDRYIKNREERLAAASEYYWQNREKKLLYQRQYERDHAEERVAYKREWRKKNPEKSRMGPYRYRQRHPERARESCRRWREDNPEKERIRGKRRQARKMGLPDTLTLEQVKHLLIIGKGTYPDEKLHLDHFIPLVKGGGATRANLHYIPAILNQRKHDKLPQEVYIQLPLEV